MARPPRFDEKATAVVSVRLTPEQRRDLLRVSVDCRTTLADVIREAVNEYVADYGERAVFRSVARNSSTH